MFLCAADVEGSLPVEDVLPVTTGTLNLPWSGHVRSTICYDRGV